MERSNAGGGDLVLVVEDNVGLPLLLPFVVALVDTGVVAVAILGGGLNKKILFGCVAFTDSCVTVSILCCCCGVDRCSGR